MGNSLSLAYLAGLFDGEGNISLMRDYSSHVGIFPTSIRCRVNMRTKLIPALFQAQFGGRLTHFKTGVTGWDVAAAEAVHFLKTILPHLILKKPQAKIAISHQELIWRGAKGKRISPSEMALREANAKALKVAMEESYGR